MYLGAIGAVARGDPESLVHAAHSMRELLEKLPTYFEEVPREKDVPSLKQAAKALVDRIESAKRSSACYSEHRWSGEIDGHLSRLLEGGLTRFASVVADQKPPRRLERTELLRRVDGSPLPMPEEIERIRIEEWERYIGFFQGVSHHSVPVDAPRFSSMLWQCESFLLNQLAPRTFEDRAAIAALVTEVERGDQD